MKKQTILILFILLSLFATAQSQLAGLTSSGGSNGFGVILKYRGGDTTTSFSSLASGGCPGCGAAPQGSLILATDGMMYGLSYDDGSNYAGTVFQYDYPTNSYTVMANFDITSTGYYPFGSLMQASNGTLYGMTTAGGTNGSGTIFSYTLGGTTVTPLVSLPSASYGAPNSLIQCANGNLYGMTASSGTNGGGMIFQYVISTNSFSTLYNLPSTAHPYGDLLQLGADTLYGMTQSDGTHSMGTIFRYIPATNAYTVLYNFDTASGGFPTASLIRGSGRKLYGTTSQYGSQGTADFGTLFSYDLSTSTFTDLHDFDYTHGAVPYGSPLLASDGSLYGMTADGGEYSDGTVYEYKVATATFSDPLSLNRTDGATPGYGHLIEYGSIATAPVITTQPTSQAVCAGSTATFAVSYTGTGTVQWQVSTGSSYSNIAGATDSIYSFTASASQTGYHYRVILTGSSSDTSVPVTLTVYSPGQSSLSASICPGHSYSFGTHSYSSAGTYRDTLIGASSHGCDSIVTLTLSVYAAAQGSLSASICPGHSYSFGTHSYSSAGTYRDTLIGASSHGCDSIVTLTLSVYTQAQSSLSASICPGHSYSFGTHSYSSAGTYRDTLTGVAAHGCDSIVTLTLSVYAQAQSSISAGICPGHSYSIGTHSYSSAGTYRDTLTGAAAHGCDSVVTLTLSVYPVYDSLHVSICPGGNYTLGSSSYTMSGVYVDTLVGASAHGCDSIVVLTLVVSPLSDTAIVHGDTCLVVGTGTAYQWYSCSAGTPISGATLTSYKAIANGTYFCVVTEGSCIDTTNCVTVTGVGIQDVSSYDFTLYPVPTSGTFIIDHTYPGTLTVEVINILGETMRTFTTDTTHAQFDISYLASGIYEVHISDAGRMLKAFKLVKQ